MCASRTGPDQRCPPLLAFGTSDDCAAWVHLLMGPILAPHRPAPAPRADEPEAVVGRNAKQHFEGGRRHRHFGSLRLHTRVRLLQQSDTPIVRRNIRRGMNAYPKPKL